MTVTLAMRKIFTILLALIGGPAEAEHFVLPERQRCSKHADLHSSSPGYAKRFEGPIGAYVLERQADVLQKCLEGKEGLTVLDVGGGHGQNVEALLENKHVVTIMGTAPEIPFRVKEHVENGRIKYVEGTFEELPFPDKSFDVCLSFRQLSHVPDPDQFLSELSRVASGAVLVDYAPLESLNILYPVFFPIKKLIERTSRPYRVFCSSKLRKMLRQNGFTQIDNFRQFTLPIGIHRLLKSPRTTRCVEGALDKIQVTKRLGSPAVIFAKDPEFTSHV